MGWHYYLYNVKKDQYYDLGKTLGDISHPLRMLIARNGWSLDDTIDIVSDRDFEINLDKVLYY